MILIGYKALELPRPTNFIGIMKKGPVGWIFKITSSCFGYVVSIFYTKLYLNLYKMVDFELV